MNKTLLSATTLSLVFTLLPFAAQALVIDTGANGQVTTGGTVVNTSVDANITASTSANTEGSANPNEILMTTSGEAAIMSSAEVHSDADLKNFTTAIATANANVNQVNIGTDHTLSVTYNHKVKLFGFIPMTMQSETRVSADAEGNAQVVTTLPWWKFLVTGDSSIAADVDAALQNSTAVKNYASASGDISANVEAQAAEVIVATLNAKAGVDLLAQ